MSPWEHSSNTHAAAEFPSTFVNFMSARQSVNSPFVHMTFHQLPLTFCLTVENVLWGSWNLRITSDNFLCGCVTYHQLSVRLRYHPSSFSESAGYSINFLCVRRTFYKLPSTLVHSRELPLTFLETAGPSVNFRQISRFHRNFCQHFLHLWDLPSTSVDFPCICRAYRNLSSTCCEAAGPPANFPFIRLTFCQHSLHPQDLSTSFNFSLLLGSSSSSTEIPTPNSWNILLWFLLFPLLSSSSSSAVLNFLELKKNSSFILVPLITQEFKQFSFF